MCGRYESSSPTPVLTERYRADPSAGVEDAVPSWNVAPTDLVRVVRPDGGARRLEAARWGLVLGDRDPPAARPLINLRAETLADRPALRRALVSGRVVIPADGFYEWERADPGPPSGAGPRRRAPGFPHHFRRADGDLIAMVGLWVANPAAPAARTGTVAVVTTAAGPDVAPIHHRMPVILEEGDWLQWIDARADPGELVRRLGPSPAGTLSVRPVSAAVNRATNDGPHLLDPPEAGGSGGASGQLTFDGL